MRQVAQRPRDGAIEVVETPVPRVRPGWVLVATRFSLISAGTERSKLELGSKNLVQKARARPDLARKVIDKARIEGVAAAVGTVRERLDGLAALGYSAAGTVLRVGAGVDGIAPGDRVACAGAGYANHAEVITCPRNLVAKVPEGVSLDDACYTTVGAIALHGVRQAEAVVGERVGVIGLGLVGQLALRILHAAGCEPIGIDRDPAAVALATAAGMRALERDAPALETAVLEFTHGLGLDSVLVCAAARSADPVSLAAQLSRDRGRLVIVGDVPVAAERTVLYEKEIELRLSRSYGPGRYDRDYEEYGRDLPAGYVRWTEQRNMEAFLELVASGRVDPTPLTTHRFLVDDAAEAYAALTATGERRPFGVLLEYPGVEPARPAQSARPTARRTGLRIGVIGAGAFARGTLVPALTAGGAELAAVASAGGLSASDVAARFGFGRVAATAEEILDDDAIDAVVIATRHREHAALAASALRAGKAVFCEKPLALTIEELEEVEEAVSAGSILMVGFNRRFAPLTERLRQALGAAEQRVLSARVNAGPLPSTHWLHDSEDGGGRLLGEACHFVDLLAHLAQAPITAVSAFAVPPPGRPIDTSDDVCAALRFLNGSVATLVYAGHGDPRMPKESIEAFAGGLAASLTDFRRLELYREHRRTIEKTAQDKGHRQQIAAFLAAAAGGAEAPSIDSYISSTRATLALAESLRTGLAVELA